MLWCCCQQGVVEQDVTLSRNIYYYAPFMQLWQASLGGELDPIEFRFPITPPWAWGSIQKRMRTIMCRGLAADGILPAEPIPRGTYSSWIMKFGAFAVDNSGIATPTDTPQDYNIYLVNRLGNYLDLESDFVSNPIPRADLVGPVFWNAASENWASGHVRTTPNLASLVNNLTTLAGWQETGHALWFVFDTPNQHAAANPPGRTVILDGSTSYKVEATYTPL